MRLCALQPFHRLDPLLLRAEPADEDAGLPQIRRLAHGGHRGAAHARTFQVVDRLAEDLTRELLNPFCSLAHSGLSFTDRPTRPRPGADPRSRPHRSRCDRSLSPPLAAPFDSV